MSHLIPIDRIQSRILILRGHKVIIDSDLAELYGVTTKRLNEQVKRNRVKFPADFVIQLTKREKKEVVANCDHLKSLKFSAVLPTAFTEHGALMASSILNTATAVKTAIFVVRAFVKLRTLAGTHRKLAAKLGQLERRVGEHDGQIRSIFEAIYELMTPAKIGFKP
jgi:hypothetical protein